MSDQPRICLHCERPITSPDALKFCSHACAAAARHARRPITTPSAATLGGLRNSDNPHFSCDERGQWWYTVGAKRIRTRAYVRECERCGGQFLYSIFRRDPRYCSRTCSARSSADATRGRFAGAQSPSWKGGRRLDDRGYVLVHQPGRKRSVYVFEHRLVMEQMLGRKLERHENVHHKNGIRDDNRPENLELWVKQQPAGARVHEQQHCPTCTCFGK